MTVPPVPPPGDEHWMRRAIALSRLCPPSPTAFNVGAVIVGADGTELASGYSRDRGPHAHAEQSALGGLLRSAQQTATDPRLATATLYSTLEPCSERRSGPPCTGLVLAAGIRRVVIAWREPELFVADCQGVELLREAGVTVIELVALEAEAKAVNRHLPGVTG
jgi:diaminohydroxyphosphoribosylaminopyrimidine deaminase/5-amino-6-(5-phosphoribosylamino)uracil reductase